MTGFRHLGDELIHRGHTIEVCTARFRSPDGTIIERDVVRHPGAVAVVPLLDDGRVVLVRQFRAPLDRLMIEIPAGRRDVAGEPLEVTARRELVEETGMEAASLEPLVVIHNSVGFCDEECTIYLGRDLRDVGHQRQGIEEEHMEVLLVPLDRAGEMVDEGEITDAKTVVGLLAALRREL